MFPSCLCTLIRYSKPKRSQKIVRNQTSFYLEKGYKFMKLASHFKQK